MIFYRPTDGDPHSEKIKCHPQTCFLMTKLGESIPKEIIQIKTEIKSILKEYSIKLIDAKSSITGKDFLMKIWNILISVPLGIGIINKDLSANTIANIFYEVGMMHAYGKEGIIIKTKEAKVPSDLVRTEYITFDEDFSDNFKKYLDYYLGLPDHYEEMADLLEKNPLLSIDYLKRAYLISGDRKYKNRAKEIYKDSSLDDRAKNSVEALLINF